MFVYFIFLQFTSALTEPSPKKTFSTSRCGDVPFFLIIDSFVNLGIEGQAGCAG
jgi:hypothetical protein